MSFLVDTCALSELVKPKPSNDVCDWFDADTAGSAVRECAHARRDSEGRGEARRQSPTRSQIAAWLETELPAWFENRVLPVDGGVADEWGRLMSRLSKPVPAIDSLIAATAIRHRLAIVTRNESDFATTGVDMLNPWTD